jgi:glycosyltransferase involved in cell wall biosynthesis
VTSTAPLVSVIVPCRNERRHIRRCLESIANSDYPPARVEILVVDGMSDDGTTHEVDVFAQAEPRVRLLTNPRRIVASALNLGIRSARGEIIVRMDAHNEYPPAYLPTLVDWLLRTDADNVGAACVTLPHDDSATARAIAIALAHPFGVGNAHFRLGVSEPRSVDTVPFGCFRRELFDRIGVFDEELVRNQDDEFNYRILRNGGMILLVPGVVSYYYGRASFSQLFRMYFQYGLFKPLVAYKVGRVVTLRQLAPIAFVLSLVIGGLLAVWSSGMRWALGVAIAAYATIAALSAARTVRQQGLRCGLALFAAFPVLHVAYGLGFGYGLIRLAFRGRLRSKQPASVPLSR